MDKLPPFMQSSFDADGSDSIGDGFNDDYTDDQALSPVDDQAPASLEWSADEPTADDPSDGGKPVAPPPIAEPAPKPAPTSRRRRSTGGPVLGAYVTPSAVHGILLRDSADRYGVVRLITRQRSAFAGEVPDLAGMTPEGEGVEGADDVTIEFGDTDTGLGSEGLFLDSEFSDLAGIDANEKEFHAQAARKQSSPVVFELKDILDECHAAGYEKTPTGYCLSQDDVEYVELLIAPSDKKGKKGKSEKKDDAPVDPSSVKRDQLLELLAENYEDPFDKERAAFIPMTPRDGQQRFLAVVPTPQESLAESLELLREQAGMRSVPFRTIDAEVPVLVGLTRWTFPAESFENTAIVRVGSEDTLVVLLQGDTLHHTEHMRSVTTFDGPDTICSRVLLQQDVQGIGTVHHVIVLSDEREREIVEGFGAFYPDANVSALREGLSRAGIDLPMEGSLPAKALPAVGVALRTLMERQDDSPFYDLNMLPKRLRRRSRKIDFAVAWHTLVTGVLLFFAVLFFMGVYFSKQADIADAQTRVDAYPEEVNLSGPALQAQIDSLQTAYLRITNTLNVIDSLLVGSDRWSRSRARSSRATASTGGAWIHGLAPIGSNLQMTGYANSRNQVVQFAERMDATIESVTFEKIRDYPVFAFTTTVPVRDELPEVARYLRANADASGAMKAPVPNDQDPLTEYDAVN
jgi:hypothetical protein